jgi:DNA polymerase-1
MLVTRTNFEAVLQRLQDPSDFYGCDTETTGLAPYKGDRIFSIIIAQNEEAWYFNFNDYEGVDEDCILDETHLAELAKLFASPLHKWDLHNAKFDLHMLRQAGIEIAGLIFCTYANGRLLHNDLRFYNLDFLSQRWLQAKKSDLVKEYALEHGLFTVSSKGKRGPVKNVQFYRVPLPIVQEYGELDTLLTNRLGRFLRQNFALLDAEYRKAGQPPLQQVCDNECALTPVLYRMEAVGVQLDKPYAERALETERRNYQAAIAAFKELVGFDYDDSPTCIQKAFKQLGIELPKGPSGRVLTNKAELAKIAHPVVDIIQTYRKSYKKATTYYANFLAMSDLDGVIHADFHQGGTKTGRLSCRDPNLQNLNRPDEDALQEGDEENAFEVRRCFIPRPDFCFFAPDYDQIEYRMLLNYAMEDALIDLVLGGLDVHAATAQMLGISRYRAKTVNFMLVYGGGIGKLAATLGITWAEAQEVYRLYFSRLPRITELVQAIRYAASSTGSTYNWLGRVYTFDNPDSVHTTAPNWLIQGGCADVLKICLIRCDEFLHREKAKSRLILNIHDEPVFELHKSELELAHPIVKIMESVYTTGRLPLTAGAAYSWKSLADKEKGVPVLPLE